MDSKKTKTILKSTRNRVQVFRRLFESNANILILINPDPDAMASALAMKRLLWKHVYRMTIARTKEIKRLDNLAMVELLKIPMVEFETTDPESFSHRVLVDSQPHHFEMLESLTFDAIIDHHPHEKTSKASYIDIRPKYGANSTILTEYLRAGGITPSMKLATALLYGIKTDTADFERSGIEDDINQFHYLLQYANMNLLKKIEKAELRPGELDYFAAAIKNRVVTDEVIYTHMGKVPNADICVQVADFFFKVLGIGWIFVSGVYEDMVIIIIRNDGYRKDAGKVASRSFGDIGSAGGHRGAARAEIPLDMLKQKGIRGHGSSLEDFIKKRLEPFL
ncbi:MAG: DHH family phosphoesterase [Thermodesulfobacteriota bacterium]|nr:DHH family phosphoesterase [Thermodesulfobacteriota bacterium]